MQAKYSLLYPYQPPAGMAGAKDSVHGLYREREGLETGQQRRLTPFTAIIQYMSLFLFLLLTPPPSVFRSTA